MRNLRFPLVFIGLLLLCRCSSPDPIIVREASGIERLDQHLLIVGDDADGRYYKLPIPNNNLPLIPVEPEKVREVMLPCAELAMDLEAIDVLADGRIAVLSERLRCLIAPTEKRKDECGIISEYDHSVAEFGNRGLEGLSVLPMENEVSRIAVMWEGGFPMRSRLPRDVNPLIARETLNPVILIHDMEKYNARGFIHDPLARIELKVPTPNAKTPGEHRFRGTDLVWHKWHEETGNPVQGFIVLLESENVPGQGGRSSIYEVKVLQRFNLDGEPVGDPFDLQPVFEMALDKCIKSGTDHLRPEVLDQIQTIQTAMIEGQWQNVNWEGLGWFEESRSLVTIYDHIPQDPPLAMIIDLPKDWL